MHVLAAHIGEHIEQRPTAAEAAADMQLGGDGDCGAGKTLKEAAAEIGVAE